MRTRRVFWGCLVVVVGILVNPVSGNGVFAQVTESLSGKPGDAGRPDWADMETYWTSGGSIFYTGRYYGGADYGLTARIAKAEAIKSLIESVSVKARSEFSYSLHGNNIAPEDLGRYVTDSVGWVVENLRIGGIKLRGVYHEKVEDNSSGRPRYNVWVLLEINRDDYLKARTGAVERLIQKTKSEKNTEARAKAEELLKRIEKET